MSPIMALLSERTEELISGKKFPFDLAQFVKDILRGIAIALRNMLIEFGFIFLCMLVVWIPIAGWVTPLFLLIISYYFYGFSMMDYSNERHKLNVSESVRYILKYKGVAIGNGFIFSLLFAFPIIGSMLSTILAPVAATIAVVELKK
jgi:CysZ protein